MKPEEFIPFLSGAGGNWQIIDEVTAPTVIQQQDRLSCGPACAEMLMEELGVFDVTQVLIASATGTPVNIPALVKTLAQFDENSSRTWVGGGFEIPGVNETELIGILISTGSWIAELRELGARLGHLVVVNGYDTEGQICIKDPWSGTSYKMKIEEFLKYWTLQGIYVKKL